MREEHRLVVDEQRHSEKDLGRMLESICEVLVAVAMLEKRPVEGETPVETSEQK